MTGKQPEAMELVRRLKNRIRDYAGVGRFYQYTEGDYQLDCQAADMIEALSSPSPATVEVTEEIREMARIVDLALRTIFEYPITDRSGHTNPDGMNMQQIAKLGIKFSAALTAALSTQKKDGG